VKNRNRTAITSQILEIALDGAGKTRIMYKAFLSHAQMKEYLEILSSNGLLQLDQNQTYKTTQKGVQFLEIYQKLEELASDSSSLAGQNVC
jgi:predicted transcriptional regulator